MEHDLYTDADADRPGIICDRNGQVVLGLCKRCGRAEAQLVEPCGTPWSLDLSNIEARVLAQLAAISPEDEASFRESNTNTGRRGN